MRIQKPAKTLIYALLLLVVAAMIALGAVFAAEPLAPYYEDGQVEPLAQGVTYEKHLRFDRNGWLTFHVVKMDATVNTVKADALVAGGHVTTPGPLSHTALSDGAIAAINGDFFFVGESNSPLGPVIRAGQLLSTPSYRSDLATLAVDQRGLAQIGYWSWQGSIKLPNGQGLTLAGLNKQGYDYSQPMIYNAVWGEQSPGSPGPGSGHVEVVVRNGKVTEIRRDLAKTMIPIDGYVVVGRQGAGTTLGQLKIGDAIQISITTSPDWQTLRTAIGGGTVLIKNGQVAAFTHDITGRNPRSAIGIGRDGKTLMLVAVDGRIPLSRGATQTELAQMLLDLGAYQAINLDGGGSTTLVTRSLDQSMVTRNHPSDGQERPVPNGLGIFSTAAKGSLSGLKLSASAAVSIPGGSVDLNLAAYDSNYSPVDIANSKLQWVVQPATAGAVIGNRLLAKATGLVQVTARIGSVQTTTEVRIIEPNHLVAEPQAVQLPWGGSQSVRLSAVDQDGWSAPIPMSMVKGSVPATLGTWSNDLFTALPSGGSEQQGAITLQYGNLSCELPVSIGEHEVILDDFSQAKVRGFIGYPQGVMGSVRPSEVNEPHYSGSTGKLSFYLPGLANTRAAYISYGASGLLLPEGSQELRLWVNGYHGTMPTDAWLRAALIDAQGNKRVLDLARHVDWDGWRQLHAPIPKDWPQPLTLDRIYVVEAEANKTQMGAVFLDDLSVTTATQLPPVATTWHDPRSQSTILAGTSLVVSGNMQLPAQGSLSGMIVTAGLPTPRALVAAGSLTRATTKTIPAEPSVYTATSKQEIKVGNYSVLTLDSRQGGLAATDPAQWAWLTEQLKKRKDQPLLLVTSLALGRWQDANEAGLVKQLLSQWAANNNQTVWLFSPGQTTTVQAANGLRIIEIGQQDMIGLSLDAKNTRYAVKMLPKP